MVGRIATRDDERLISEAGAKLLAPVLGDIVESTTIAQQVFPGDEINCGDLECRVCGIVSRSRVS